MSGKTEYNLFQAGEFEEKTHAVINPYKEQFQQINGHEEFPKLYEFINASEGFAHSDRNKRGSLLI